MSIYIERLCFFSEGGFGVIVFESETLGISEIYLYLYFYLYIFACTFAYILALALLFKSIDRSID